jgi:hypothetical protein
MCCSSAAAGKKIAAESLKRPALGRWSFDLLIPRKDQGRSMEILFLQQVLNGDRRQHL